MRKSYILGILIVSVCTAQNGPSPSEIEAAEAALLAHPHVTVPVAEDGVDIIRNQAVGIIRVVPVMFETPSSFIEPIKTAAPATHPEITRCIFVNAIYVSALTELILVARVGNVIGDLGRLSIESVQGARKEAYPQNATGLPINRLDPAG